MNESRKYKALNLYLTGYGIFEGVTNNPTELLIRKIEDNKTELSKHLGSQVRLKHTDVFKVAIRSVDEKANEIYSKIEESNISEEELHLLVHFGVYMEAPSIQLENVAKNAFDGDDVEGCTIDGKIDNQCLHDRYQCKLDLQSICKHLIEKNHKVEISEDAGTYLCNYVYFKSSQKWNHHHNVLSIFVHVPSEETMPVDSVYNCVLDMLVCIKQQFLTVV